MTSKESLVYHAFRGLAAGLIGEADAAPTVASDANAKRRKTRASVPRKRRVPPHQLPLSPEMEARLRDSLVPLDPRSPMDDYETAVPTAEQLDKMFAGADPENEAVAALRRQMEMQRVSSELQGPQKKPEDAPFVWGGIPDR